MDRKAEALDRDIRQLNLVVYDVPYTAEQDDIVMGPLLLLLGKCMPDDPLYEGLDGSNHGWVHPAQIRRGHVRYVCTSSH